MKLVDDDHVEVMGRQIIKSRSAQALNGCEYMVKAPGRLPPTQSSPKEWSRKAMRNVSETLLKDFFSMSDEQ